MRRGGELHGRERPAPADAVRPAAPCRTSIGVCISGTCNGPRVRGRRRPHGTSVSRVGRCVRRRRGVPGRASCPANGASRRPVCRPPAGRRDQADACSGADPPAPPARGSITHRRRRVRPRRGVRPTSTAPSWRTCCDPGSLYHRGVAGPCDLWRAAPARAPRPPRQGSTVECQPSAESATSRYCTGSAHSNPATCSHRGDRAGTCGTTPRRGPHRTRACRPTRKNRGPPYRLRSVRLPRALAASAARVRRTRSSPGHDLPHRGRPLRRRRDVHGLEPGMPGERAQASQLHLPGVGRCVRRERDVRRRDRGMPARRIPSIVGRMSSVGRRVRRGGILHGQRRCVSERRRDGIRRRVSVRGRRVRFCRDLRRDERRVPVRRQAHRRLPILDCGLRRGGELRRRLERVSVRCACGVRDRLSLRGRRVRHRGDV
jgi:hypothetical protein